MRNKFLADFVALMVACSFASFAEAAPAKKKVATKRAAITQSVANYSCEGRVGITSGTAIGGFSRSEDAVTFLMSVNSMNGVVTIMQARGSRLIKSGRFALMRNGSSFTISIPWTDYNGAGQYFDLYVSSDGSFSGNAMSSTPSNFSTTILDAVLGYDSGLFKPQTSYSVEGICWK